jgi:hypothetical protein
MCAHISLVLLNHIQVPKDNRGNPKIKNHGFRTDKEEPLTANLSFRVTESMKEEVKSKDDPAQFCRDAIQKALDEDRQKQSE